MQRQRWYQLEGAELGTEVEALGKSLYDAQSWRRSHAFAAWRTVEPQPLLRTPYDAGLTTDLRLRLARSGAETVQADIAGRQRPKPQFQTAGSDWQTRRRAKKLDKFVVGQLSQRQGPWRDSWELMGQLWPDAACWGTGVAKVYADHDDGLVRVERTRVYDLYVDEREADYGDPRNLFQVSAVDRDLLLEQFPDSEEAIARAPRFESDAPALYTSSSMELRRVAEQVQVIEAWRLGSSGHAGKHAITVGGHVLLEEDWERNDFPFVFLHWSRPLLGFWGVSLVDEIREIEQNHSELLRRLHEGAVLNASTRVYYEQGSINEDHLADNDSEVHIPVTPGSQLPQVQRGMPIDPAMADYVRYLQQLALEIVGISGQTASGRKEQGVTSGVAIRTVRDIGTQRQAMRVRAYESAFVELGRKIVRSVRELAEDNPGFATYWPGRSFLESIQWDEVSLDEDMYQVSISPSTTLPNDPAGRLSLLGEMYQQQLISPTQYKRLLDWPDLDQLFSRDNAEHDYIEDLIDKYLDAEDPEADGVYISPDGFLGSPESAMVQVAAAYYHAAREGAPDGNLELLRRFLEELQLLIDRRMQAQAQAQPQGPPGPPGPMPPGV